MKKTKKALASLAIAGMAMTMVPFNAFATGTVPTRLGGTTAAQTAAAIADQTGWTGTAILASSASYGMVDALTAGPLATYLKAPILLTGAGNSLDADTKAELNKLSVKTVYVTSGTAVIKQAVLDELSGMGITVVPLGGVDRAATSVNIAKKMGTVTKVAVANGLQDALSIAAIASAAGEPILLTDKDALPASVSAYLAANPGITASDVIGGTGVISDAVKAALPNATRHAGTTAYDTNNQVIQDFNSSLAYTNVFVANGVTGIDALAGAPLAAQTKSPIVLTDGTVPAAASFVHGKLATGAVVTALGGSAVVSSTVVDGVTNGVVTPGDLAVTSVSAVSANSFKVVFTKAPADTSKVTFTVKGSSGTVVTVTPTWNTANTEATVTSSYNFAPDTYSVDVMNDKTDLGTSSVAITAQAVKSITITSTVLSVAPIQVDPVTKLETANSGEGYATYKVVDQYGNDITNTPLGNNINWTPGIGTLDSTVTKNGVIGIQKSGGIALTQYTSATINGYDTDNYVSVSASLPVSQSSGVISGITLNKLTSPNNDDFNAGNTTGQWYVDYTALDASGNVTSNYNLLKAGILTYNGGAFLDINLVQDPADNTKAAFSVKVDPQYAASLAADTQVPITVLTAGGKSATLNVTLKKATSVNTFTVSAPTQMVASGETVMLPFSALDQNGTAVVNYSDLIDGNGNPKVNLTISGGGSIALVRNSDGTAGVQAVMPTLNTTGSLTIYVQSNVVATGKSSQLTLNVQQPKKPDTLAVDNTVAPTLMQLGSAQKLDFGWDTAGFALNDQYGRAMDMTDEDTTGDYYYIVPSVNGNSVGAAIDANDPLHKGAYGKYGITLTATADATKVGTSTVTYTVWKHTAATNSDAATTISKSVSYTVVKQTDIVGAFIDKAVNPIKCLPIGADTSHAGIISAAAADAGNKLNPGTDSRDTEYAFNPEVWGATSGGGKVVLNPTTIQSISVDSSDFVLENQADGTTGTTLSGAGAVASNKIMLYAKDFPTDATKTGSSTTLTVTIWDSTGNLHNITTTVKSTTDSPVVSKIAFAAWNETGAKGIDVTGNTVTVKATDATVAGLNGMLTRYASDGSIGGILANGTGTGTRSNVYFKAYDQFGTKSAPISQVIMTDSHFAGITNADITKGALSNGPVTAKLDANNVLTLTNAAGAPATAADIANGDYILLTATSANGQIQTVKIVFSK